MTFNCGGSATIPLSQRNNISAATTIDGGGVITISGGNSVKVFTVNTGVALTIENLTITNGYASSDNGGAIDSGGTVTVNNCIFFGNRAISGGAIDGGTLTVTNSSFSENASISNGGAIAIGDGGTVTVTNSTFSGNSAGADGGGIASSGTLTVTNSTFSDNSAGYGGGIAGAGMLTVTNSTFSGNSASLGGGAITSGNGATVTVTNSTFSGNSAADKGGGGINNGGNGGGTLTVTNSTFSGNSAGAINGGGGIANNATGTLTVTNSTFSGNSAGSGGGIANNSSGTATVTNTIVATSISGGNCSGTITDGGHNIDDGTTCGFTGTGCTSTSGSSFCNTNPQFDAAGLANNGGPTQTIALQATSTAVDGGDETVCSMTTGTAPVNRLDQRGFVRPGAGHTHCSIGAYEFNSLGPPCVGDCGGDDQVTVDELLTMVNIALGNAGVSSCSTGDANDDGQITVDEILTAVNNALNGCPLTPGEQGCLTSGGTVTTAMCCAATGDFPDTCAIGACGCPPEASHEVRVCSCGAGNCFDGTGCVTQ